MHARLLICLVCGVTQRRRSWRRDGDRAADVLRRRGRS